MFVCALRRVASCGERSHVGMFLRGWARFAHAPVQTLQESEQGALHASCVAAQHSLLVVAPQPWPAAAPSLVRSDGRSAPRALAPRCRDHSRHHSSLSASHLPTSGRRLQQRRQRHRRQQAAAAVEAAAASVQPAEAMQVESLGENSDAAKNASRSARRRRRARRAAMPCRVHVCLRL